MSPETLLNGGRIQIGPACKWLTQEEIQAVLTGIVQEEGLSGMADLGKLMKTAMGRMRGRADGSLVSSLAKETLGGSSN